MWNRDPNAPIGKEHARFIVCHKPWGAIDEVRELRSVEYQIIEQGYPQLVE